MTYSNIAIITPTGGKGERVGREKFAVPLLRSETLWSLIVFVWMRRRVHRGLQGRFKEMRTCLLAYAAF